MCSRGPRSRPNSTATTGEIDAGTATARDTGAGFIAFRTESVVEEIAPKASATLTVIPGTGGHSMPSGCDMFPCLRTVWRFENSLSPDVALCAIRDGAAAINCV